VGTRRSESKERIFFNEAVPAREPKMERAIVLINLNPGAEEQSLRELKQTQGVKSVYQLYGLYDMLVVVEGADDQAVKAIISDRLRSRPGVVSTITMKVLS
jgi:DNA-binding Lrp family transcriptional regulator